jgi:uroporphyrinogen decarboxylase
MLYARPDLLHRVLSINAEAVAGYLAQQIACGADAVMIFDTWGGLLAADSYPKFSLSYIAHVIERLRETAPTTPVIVFTKGGGQWLERIAKCGCDAVGVDWTTDIGAARQRIGEHVAVQGNLDPVVLLTNPATVDAEVRAIIARAGTAPGHIFNLGHGIMPSTPPENVAALVECVHAESRARLPRTSLA